MPDRSDFDPTVFPHLLSSMIISEAEADPFTPPFKAAIPSPTVGSAALDDGRSVFVKSATDPETARWLEDERRIYTSLTANFLPRFIGWHDGEYPLLILEDLSRGEWHPHWTGDRVNRVLKLLERVAATEPPPILRPLDGSSPSSELTGCTRYGRIPLPF